MAAHSSEVETVKAVGPRVPRSVGYLIHGRTIGMRDRLPDEGRLLGQMPKGSSG